MCSGVLDRIYFQEEKRYYVEKEELNYNKL